MQKINKLISSIFEISLSNLNTEANWETVSINACVLNKMVEIIAFHSKDEKHEYFNPKKQGHNSRAEDLTFLFKDLREEMHAQAPEKGAWYTAYFTVQNNGQFQTHFEYNEKPEFTYEPSKEKFIDDLNKFPREENLIPQWLKEIIKP
jgi:hypothetical protein